MVDAGPSHRNPVVRLAYDRDGNLKGTRLLAISASAAVVVTIGTTIAVVMAGAGSPGALALWTTVAFLGVKVPLLGLLWWLLGRHVEAPGEHRWDEHETREILERLRSATRFAEGADDEKDRLAILAEEAWFVADNASDEMTAEATQVALEIRAKLDRTPTSA